MKLKLGKLGRWINNFLSKRQQQVFVKGKKSIKYQLTSGILQGSVVGPLLFLIFIGDLAEGVNYDTLVYVDDSKAKKRVNDETEVECLQEDLDKIYSWQSENNMEFNSKKFLVLRYGKNNTLKETTEYFTGEMELIIEEVESCNDLGVIMTNDGKFEAQIEKSCSKDRLVGY